MPLLSRLRTALATALLLPAALLPAQGPVVAVPQPGPPALHDVSPAEYRAHLDQLRSLVADCGRIITACDATRVGDDNRVLIPGRDPVTQRFGWLRDLLVDRNDPSHSLRREMLPRAEQRLSEQEAELDQPPATAPLTASQRAARDTVLDRSEFRIRQDFSLRERIGAWISQLLYRLFSGISSVGTAAPWLGRTLQWSCLILVAALLVLWIFRTLDRQRVALGRLHGDAARAAQLAESRAWADLARRHADAGEFRDAVHCLYWASIVALEDRRTLRRSNTRTPREALRLLDPASQLRGPLQSQTADFERIWYGLQPAAADDYQTALACYSALGGSRQTGAAA